jgi:hypothetical protein
MLFQVDGANADRLKLRTTEVGLVEAEDGELLHDENGMQPSLWYSNHL